MQVGDKIEKRKSIALITLLLMASTATALASPGILATKNYAFSINIPAFGSIYDQEKYFMSSGKYCMVQRTDSSTWNASFRVVDFETLVPLSDWVEVRSGETKLIYTNTSGTTQAIRFDLSARAPFSIKVEGYFKFGEF